MRFHTAWVKFGSPGALLGSPLYPQEQTSSAGPVRSEKCHERTRAVQQKALLLNNLVRKTHVRKVEPECLGGLEIDYQFKLRWLHDRQFGRLFAFEIRPT